MRNLIFCLIVLLLISTAFAAVRARGSLRKSGAYVTSHYRSNPDGSKFNNWSTKGNANPYTGKRGTRSIW
jgi:hypothetical protein